MNYRLGAHDIAPTATSGGIVGGFPVPPLGIPTHTGSGIVAGGVPVSTTPAYAQAGISPLVVVLLAAVGIGTLVVVTR